MKRLFLSLFAAFAVLSAFAGTAILSAGTTVAAGAAFDVNGHGARTYQVVGSTSAGAGSTTVAIQGSNNGTNWDTIGTVTLTLSTAAASNGFSSADAYDYVRANVTAISGTGAAVSVFLGN